MTLTLGIGPEIAGLPAFEEQLAALVEQRVASRIFALDASLWGADAAPEAAARLGWTDFAAGAAQAIAEAATARSALLAAGVDRIVLCGMGGSSLAPAVIARWAGVPLTVLDSTHPDVVARALGTELARTAVVISSKSGSTIETLSHRAAFERAFAEAGIDAAERIIVVTDPGSPIEEAATEAGQRVCNADPDVGGRFSALTAFGLVPAGLAGADIAGLVAEAEAVRDRLAEDSPENPALRLAAAIACGLPERYILGIHAEPSADWGFGTWIEQLVAESTGKDGKGVFPISLPAQAPELQRHAESVTLVELLAPGSADAREGIVISASLGAAFLLWEVATAALGRVMEIDPFNQPDVESAKVAARAVLADPEGHPAPVGIALAGTPGARLLAAPEGSALGADGTPEQLIAALRGMVPDGGYLAIQAYLDPESDAREPLHRLRDLLAEVLEVPVALGWGPRYLHSVGQLHKGGPALGSFLQLCDAELREVAIPDSESGFDTLIAAQAQGDRAVLTERGRPVVALSLSDRAGVIGLLNAELERLAGAAAGSTGVS